MKRIKVLILGLLLTSVFTLPAWAGTLTSNQFLNKPSLGARGQTEKGAFDAGLDRVDARLGKEIWVGDPKYGSTFQTAVTAIGSTPAILHIPVGTHTISADLTTPATLTLKPERGAILNIADTKTLTINGGLEAGLYQIFSKTGTGKVILGLRIACAYPEWGGAVTNSVTDSGDAINFILDAARGFAIPVHFSQGCYLTSKSLNFTNPNLLNYGTSIGWKISGAGVFVTHIKSKLDEAYPLCDFTGTDHPSLSDIYLDAYGDGPGTSQATCGLLLARETGTNRGNNALINNVNVGGGSKAAVVMVSFDLSTLLHCVFSGNSAPALYCGAYDDLSAGSKFQTINSTVLGNTNQTFLNCTFQASRANVGGVVIFADMSCFTMYNCFGIPGGYATSFVELAKTGGHSAFMFNCRTEVLGTPYGDTSILEMGATCVTGTNNGHISGNYYVKGNSGCIKLKPGLEMNNYHLDIVPMYNPPDFPYLISGGGRITNSVIYNTNNLPGQVAAGSYGNTIYQSSQTPWPNLFGGVNGNRIVTSQGDMFNNLSIGDGGITIRRHLQGGGYWDPGTVGDGAIASTTIAVPGANRANGDVVVVGFSRTSDQAAGIFLSGAITYSSFVTLGNFTGSGLNDAAFQAFPYYNGTTINETFKVVIDSVGATDTFKWQRGSGSWHTGVAITGNPQLLEYGVAVKFTAKTGHTLGDAWDTLCGLGTVTVSLLNKSGGNFTPGQQLLRVGIWQY